jgi:multiple antibiotic resistance protein
MSIGYGQIFTLFFITLGPLKMLGPYGQQTRNLAPAALRALSVRVFLISLAAVAVGGYLGAFLAQKWRVSLPAMELTAGIILFLVAIRLVLAPYEPQQLPAEPLPDAPMKATLRLTFPLVVTPYGIAALIGLLVAAEPSADVGIYAILVLVMVVNLLGMLFVRDIMRGAMLLILQILGAVLGVVQVGLAIQFIIRGLRDLQVLPEIPA